MYLDVKEENQTWASVIHKTLIPKDLWLLFPWPTVRVSVCCSTMKERVGGDLFWFWSLLSLLCVH